MRTASPIASVVCLHPSNRVGPAGTSMWNTLRVEPPWSVARQSMATSPGAPDMFSRVLSSAAWFLHSARLPDLSDSHCSP